MYSTISFLSQMWLPEVITSTPCSRKPFAIGGVTPAPAAAFSTLTTARSTSYCFLILGSRVSMARRPGAPSLGHLHRARLADHDDLDVTGVLHLGLDTLADVLGELVGVEVGDLV